MRRDMWAKNQRHGMSRTPTYRSWANMWSRCHNPKIAQPHVLWREGHQGLQAMRMFLNFLADMGERPPGTSLDRIKSHLGLQARQLPMARSKYQARLVI